MLPARLAHSVLSADGKEARILLLIVDALQEIVRDSRESVNQLQHQLGESRLGAVGLPWFAGAALLLAPCAGICSCPLDRGQGALGWASRAALEPSASGLGVCLLKATQTDSAQQRRMPFSNGRATVLLMLIVPENFCLPAGL